MWLGQVQGMRRRRQPSGACCPHPRAATPHLPAPKSQVGVCPVTQEPRSHGPALLPTSTWGKLRAQSGSFCRSSVVGTSTRGAWTEGPPAGHSGLAVSPSPRASPEAVRTGPRLTENKGTMLVASWGSREQSLSPPLGACRRLFSAPQNSGSPLPEGCTSSPQRYSWGRLNLSFWGGFPVPHRPQSNTPCVPFVSGREHPLKQVGRSVGSPGFSLRFSLRSTGREEPPKNDRERVTMGDNALQ